MSSESRRRPAVIVAGGVLALACAALVVLLVVRGIDFADKLSSVIGMFVGIAGLVIAAVALRPLRRPRREDPADGEADPDPPATGARATYSIVADRSAVVIGEGMTVNLPNPAAAPETGP